MVVSLINIGKRRHRKKHIVFEYRDEYCKDGKFHEQECIVESVEQMIEIYGLNDCEWNILDVEEMK